MEESPKKEANLRPLQRAAERLRSQVRLTRGHGAHGLVSLIQRIAQNEVTMDEQTAQELALVIESTTYALEDLEAEKQRAHRQPWRI